MPYAVLPCCIASAHMPHTFPLSRVQSFIIRGQQPLHALLDLIKLLLLFTQKFATELSPPDQPQAEDGLSSALSLVMELNRFSNGTGTDHP